MKKRRKKAKKAKKSEKSEKNEKIDLNFASLCFASKQKLLNRSEAKNLKRKKAHKKSEKKPKNAKNSEKKWEKVKKSKKIDLNFASLGFASKWKLLKWSEAKIFYCE